MFYVQLPSGHFRMTLCGLQYGLEKQKMHYPVLRECVIFFHCCCNKPSSLNYTNLLTQSSVGKKLSTARLHSLFRVVQTRMKVSAVLCFPPRAHGLSSLAVEGLFLSALHMAFFIFQPAVLGKSPHAFSLSDLIFCF